MKVSSLQFMYNVKLLLIVVLLIILGSKERVVGQSADEIESMKKVIKVNKTTPSYNVAIHSASEFKILTSLLYSFYKNFISSQDVAACSFRPSCSTYMKRAIQEQGFLWGIMNGSDRLLRCTNLNRSHYKKADSSHLLLDPLERDPFIKSHGQ